MDLFSPPLDSVNPFKVDFDTQIESVCKLYTKEVGFRREVIAMIRNEHAKGAYQTWPEIKSFVAFYWKSIQ